MMLTCAYCGKRCGSQLSIGEHLISGHNIKPSDNLEITATDDGIFFVKVAGT